MSDLEIGMTVSARGSPTRGEAVVFDFIYEYSDGIVQLGGDSPDGSEEPLTAVVCCEIDHLDANAPGWRTGACRDPAAFHAFLDRHDGDLDVGLFMVPADQLIETGYPNQRPPDELSGSAGGDR